MNKWKTPLQNNGSWKFRSHFGSQSLSKLSYFAVSRPNFSPSMPFITCNTSLHYVTQGLRVHQSQAKHLSGPYECGTQHLPFAHDMKPMLFMEIVIPLLPSSACIHCCIWFVQTLLRFPRRPRFESSFLCQCITARRQHPDINYSLLSHA